MLSYTSAKTRFIVSVAANFSRSGIGFLTGLLVARGLTPSGYGDYSFLLGSFAAIRSLLDMGSSTAFYTFIAQKSRRSSFYIVYFGWLALQFVITALLLTVFMPQTMVDKVWLGHSGDLIFIAFVASFMQQQVWQTISQIGEAARKTVRVQTISLAVGITHLGLVSFLLINDRLSLNMLFLLIIFEYILATIWSFRLLRGKELDAGNVDVEPFSFKTTLEEYKKYCKPLILVAWAGFLCEFADRWMLQRFGGSGQQGYYQIANQLSTVSLLATSSIANVFWKEIAEAHGRGDAERVRVVYHKVNRGLVMFGAVLSALLIPWTEQIVAIVLGHAYDMAVPVLVIMFLYPIHQSMGYIGTTMLLAGGNTKAYMFASVGAMLVSLPFSYLSQAPVSGMIIPGLGLGGLGMALKTVLLNIASVNFLAFVVARYNKWKYEWLYQVVGIGSVLGLGFLSKVVIGCLWDLNIGIENHKLVLPILVYVLIYGLQVCLLLWALPWLVGMTKEEMSNFVIKLRSIFQRTYQ